jgi:SpoVK/Ycf46/Vps4 family AAA+-type ATPase
MNISKERIDEVFEIAVKNHFGNIENDFITAMSQIPEQKDNAVAREIIAVSIAQSNVLAAMKEVFYELLIK